MARFVDVCYHVSNHSITLQVADLEARLQAELEARLGGEGAAGAMADLRRLDAALAAAADAEELRQRAALVSGLQAQVRGTCPRWSLPMSALLLAAVLPSRLVAVLLRMLTAARRATL